MIKRNNSSLNINNENTYFITNNNLNQQTNIKEAKNNKIPNSFRQNEIHNKNSILFNKRNIHSYKENNKNNNSFNLNNNKYNSSNKKVINKLFHNNSKSKDKKSKKENIKNRSNLEKSQKNLKNEKSFKDLILNSSFSEKSKECKENKDKKIEIYKINLLLNKFDKNENLKNDYDRNDTKILKENKEFKNLDNNNDEYKNINSNEIDINNNSQNSYISTSLINNPSLTNYDENYIDTGSFCLNNNNDGNTNNNYEVLRNELDINSNDINYNINNSENIFTLNINSNNNIYSPIENLETHLYSQSNKSNNNIQTDSSYEKLKDENSRYIYNTSKINSEQIQYERYNNLYNLLYDFLKWELILENIKINLASRGDINIHLLFEIFDINKRKSISLSNISKTLMNFGMDINMEDAKYILLQNNKKLKERFNFEEFCEIVLPNNKIKRKEMYERNNSNINRLSDKTINIICLLFQKIIEGERSNEFYRNNLATVPKCSGFELFNLLKKNNSVGIYKEDIDIFLSSRRKVFYNNETELIMKKLDKNKDGVVDYTEFLTEITPKFFF